MSSVVRPFGAVSKRMPMVIVMALVMLLVTAMPVLADDGDDATVRGKLGGMPFQWKATSPAIQEGDGYDLVVTNTGDEAQEALIRTVIMDHANHANTDVVDERVELAPGEEREFTRSTTTAPPTTSTRKSGARPKISTWR